VGIERLGNSPDGSLDATQAYRQAEELVRVQVVLAAGEVAQIVLAGQPSVAPANSSCCRGALERFVCSHSSNNLLHITNIEILELKG
jgi:hypothetical protein